MIAYKLLIFHLVNTIENEKQTCIFTLIAKYSNDWGGNIFDEEGEIIVEEGEMFAAEKGNIFSQLH